MNVSMNLYKSTKYILVYTRRPSSTHIHHKSNATHTLPCFVCAAQSVAKHYLHIVHLWTERLVVKQLLNIKCRNVSEFKNKQKNKTENGISIWLNSANTFCSNILAKNIRFFISHRICIVFVFLLYCIQWQINIC